ncbi:unnamed protein product, partial [Didymodactylos carnosus]
FQHRMTFLDEEWYEEDNETEQENDEDESDVSSESVISRVRFRTSVVR